MFGNGTSRVIRIGSVAVFLVGLASIFALTTGVTLSLLTGTGFNPAPSLAAPKPLKAAYARVRFSPNTAGKFFEKSRNVNDVQAVDGAGGRVYCFDLAFVPKVAAGSAFINNNATIAVWLPGQDSKPACPAGTDWDAAAKTLAGNTSEQLSIINFNIVFHG